MHQIGNETPFSASRALLLDGAGHHVWVVVVKATYRFDLGGDVELGSEQEGVCHAPVYSGEPGRSHLLREAEVVIDHPGTDVTLNATAHAAGGKEVTQLQAGVAVGDLRQSLLVVGDRTWEPGLSAPRLSSPRPFRKMPVTWERAFGGGTGSEREARNPIGRGRAQSAAELQGQPAPNIEDPANPIETWRSRPAPVGLGAVAPDFSPRAERAGTYDEAWQRTRMPLWPADFDPRFFQSAPPALVSDKPLRGGEPVALLHLTEEPVVKLKLPRVEVVIHTQIGAEHVRQKVQLDRVILEPEDRRLVLVWRSSLDVGRAGRAIKKSSVSTKAVLR